MNHRVVDREALVGVIIAGGFGIGWAFWAASGLSGGTAAVMRVAGVVIGAVIVAGALFRYSTGPGGPAAIGESGSMFRSRGYLVWVAVELIAIVTGNLVLGAIGQGGYVAAWTAAVVGVHFIAFGRLFAAIFYALGVAFIVAAIVGAVVGAASGTRQAVEASTGLIAAAALFAAGAWGLLTFRSTGTR